MKSSFVLFAEPLSEEGYWWLPNAPENRVAGTLSFAPSDTAKLSLLGTLTNPLAIFNNSTSDDQPTIFGILRSGKSVTLHRCIRTSAQMRFPGISGETFLAHWILLGGHQDNVAAPDYRASWTKFEGIDRWLDHRHIDVEPGLRAGQASIQIQPIEEQVIGSFREGVFFAGGLSSYGPDDREHFSITTESIIGIESHAPQNFGWHLERLASLRGLASVCSGHDLQLQGIALEVAEGPEPSEHGPTKIDAVTSLLDGPTDNKRRETDRPILTANELLSANPEAFQSWLDNYDKFRPALDLFFSLTGRNIPAIEIRFVLAIQALEVFDRIENPTSKEALEHSHGQSEMIISSLPINIDEELSERLTGFLKFSHEPNLRQRLKRLTRSLGDHLPKPVMGLDRATINAIVNSRNYYTHYNASGKAGALKGANLHWVTRRLVAILTVLILSKTGTPLSNIASGLKHHREFRRLVDKTGMPA